jgi:hypothetical protein
MTFYDNEENWMNAWNDWANDPIMNRPSVSRPIRRRCPCGSDKVLVHPNGFNRFKTARYVCASKKCPHEPANRLILFVTNAIRDDPGCITLSMFDAQATARAVVARFALRPLASP